MALTRTAKSCGSDAPMLASSLREEAQMTVSNKLVTGKSTKETVKPLRGECRVISGVTVVTMLVCFVLFRTRGCGRIGRPAFPAPSDSKGERFMHSSGDSRRGNAKVCSMNANALHSHSSSSAKADD